MSLAFLYDKLESTQRATNFNPFHFISSFRYPHLQSTEEFNVKANLFNIFEYAITIVG